MKQKAFSLFIVLTLCCLQGAFAKTIKVLAIGNSFSEDAIEQNLHELGKAAGDELIIGNLYIGGCPLKRHWDNAENDRPAYRYRKIGADGKTVQTDSKKLGDAIAEEDWDYISLQQASGVSGIETSYEPYLTNLLAYVRRLAPKSKILWHQTWAYAKNSTHGEFPNYGRSQTKMYNMIAIQNARNTYIGDTMNRDGYHLNLVYGRYTAACVWFEVITGKNVTKNAYAPAAMDKRMIETCQMAAHDAVRKPWKVTVRKTAAK